MSTFDGLIREFPNVAIDNFKKRPGVNVYLLSHVHSDHLTGLAAKNWDSPIYCSQITAKWLPMLATRSRQLAFETGEDRTLQRKYAHLEPYLRPLATDVPHYLDLGNGRNARLSLIPAHHCPGAVMFLLQDDCSCIMYTGDARNEPLDLQALSSMPIFSSSTQRIDRLYLDTTFCHQAFEKFPSRETVISDLVTFINRRPRLAHYYIDAWTFGYEDIWVGLAKAFHTKIHVAPYMYGLYEAIDDLIHPKILPHLTMDGTSARFHSCRLGKTCGYGGAGGEHSSARELIRIQPNVAWFSPLLNKSRPQADAETILAQGQVIGRTSTFKIKERLPQTIGKRDDLCYYINYTFHASLTELQQLVRLVSPRALFPCVLHRDATLGSLFRSNKEIVALLAKSMVESTFSRDVEEYGDRRLCFADGITTDFQSFHRAKGYQVLDMNDEIQGITSETSSRRPSRKDTESHVVDVKERITDTTVFSTKATSTENPSPALSPRSRHLRRKMEKLKRQLRNTASLEEEALSDESSLDDGPLSLDLAVIERKRKWWVEYDRGKSTTQEDQQTTNEEIDPRNTSFQSSGSCSTRPTSVNHGSRYAESLESPRHDSCASATNGQLHNARSANQEAEKPAAWFDKSTLELELSVIMSDEDDRYVVKANESTTSKGYISSSPDPDSSYISLTDSVSGSSSYPISSAKSILDESCFMLPISATVPEQVDTVTRLTGAVCTGVEGSSGRAAHADIPKDHLSISSGGFTLPSLSLANVMSSPPVSIPKSPPRLHTYEIDLGESPSASDYRWTAPRPPTSPTIKRSRTTHATTASSKRHEPIQNIFAQLAWSPPLQPVTRRKRSSTDPRYNPQRELKQHSSAFLEDTEPTTTVTITESGEEIILVSDEDECEASPIAKQESQQQAKKSAG
ncbi:MAG: hypothetical protein J3Q66DRAFT_355004 [Benniella sp.]|nr:MAG: hypothetical protein J3Q66DRAFT_355004 [Benniella sp.]